MLIRLNKHLSSLGIASRRKIDNLISLGQIKVNNNIASLGQKINPSADVVTINSKPISNYSPNYTYIILNKPQRVLTTTKDDRGRITVLDFVKSKKHEFQIIPHGVSIVAVSENKQDIRHQRNCHKSKKYAHVVYGLQAEQKSSR